MKKCYYTHIETPDKEHFFVVFDQNVVGPNYIEVLLVDPLNDEKSHIFVSSVGSGSERHTWKI